MRHQKLGRKFGRNTSHRRAMFRNLTANLILHERLETTDAKAKELRRVAERLVTKAVRLGEGLTVDLGKLPEAERQEMQAKRIHVEREIARFMPAKRMVALKRDENGKEQSVEVDLVHKLCHEIAPRFVERAKAGKCGGYTRVFKTYRRRGDNAALSVIEFISDGVDAAAGAEDSGAEAAAE